jgi:hypothetical protein
MLPVELLCFSKLFISHVLIFTLLIIVQLISNSLFVRLLCWLVYLLLSFVLASLINLFKFFITINIYQLNIINLGSFLFLTLLSSIIVFFISLICTFILHNLCFLLLLQLLLNFIFNLFLFILTRIKASLCTNNNVYILFVLAHFIFIINFLFL